MLQFVPYNDNMNGEILPNQATEFKLRINKTNLIIQINTQFHKNFYSFFSVSSLITFIDNDGISLIFLLLEYFYQLLSKVNNNTSYPNKDTILDIM